MRKPKIDIIDNKVFIDGKKARKMSDSGHCRGIFYNDQYIVKTTQENQAWDMYTEGQNKHEYHLWNKVIKKNDKKYFAKVISYRKNKYLVQERIYSKKGIRSTKNIDLIYKISRKYNLTDTVGRNDNWKVDINGIPKIFDYGF